MWFEITTSENDQQCLLPSKHWAPVSESSLLSPLCFFPQSIGQRSEHSSACWVCHTKPIPNLWTCSLSGCTGHHERVLYPLRLAQVHQTPATVGSLRRTKHWSSLASIQPSCFPCNTVDWLYYLSIHIHTGSQKNYSPHVEMHTITVSPKLNNWSSDLKPFPGLLHAQILKQYLNQTRRYGC